MVKTLQRHGNSHALVIDKALLDAIGATPDSPLQVSVSGQSLIITPANVGIGGDAVMNSVSKLRPRYNKMLKKLAE